jgi:hypothetical protein
MFRQTTGCCEGDVVNPADKQLIEHIQHATRGGCRLLCTLARCGKALERDEPHRAEFLLARIPPGLDPPGVPALLRSGVEPGGVHLGPLEAARTTQRLPQRLLPAQSSGAADSATHAPPPAIDHRLLATGFFVVRMTLYYARLNNCWSQLCPKCAPFE